MPTAEQVRETKAGPLLDAMFFETCWGWGHTPTWKYGELWGYWYSPDKKEWNRCPRVSTDANSCEAWAMRWCAENKLSWRIDKTGRRGECRAELFGTCGSVAEICTHAYGIDWKEAFVRACIVAAINLQAKGT